MGPLAVALAAAAMTLGATPASLTAASAAATDPGIKHGPAPAGPKPSYSMPRAASGSQPSDEQNASAAAKASGTAVEVASRTSETVKVTANPDGTFTMMSSAVPVRVKRNGAWTPVDATLARNADGTFSPKASTIGIAFSGGGKGPAVTVTVPGGSKSLAITWPTALPAPSVSGNVATYADVLPGVDLRLAAAGSSYSEVLIVHDAAAAANPALRALSQSVHGNGLKVGSGADRGLEATDASGSVVLHSPQAVMWDSHLDAHMGPAPTADDSGSGIVTPLPTTVTPASSALGGAGSDAQVTVAPPASALTGAKPTYPLYIDPQFGHGEQHWLLVSDQGLSFFDSTTQNAKTGYCDYSDCTTPYANMQAYFQMNTAELSTLPNGSHASVSSASFTINEVWNAAGCAAEPVDLFSAGVIASGQAWPGPIGKLLATASSAAGGSTTSCPAGAVQFSSQSSSALLTYMQTAAANGSANTTFAIRADSYNNDMQWKQFSVSTSTSPVSPLLTVNFSYPPVVTPNGLGSTAGVGGSYNCTGPVVTSNSAPTLWATPTTSYSEQAALNFQVMTAANPNAPVASGSSGIGGSGVPGAWTVPSALADGQYTWRVQAVNGSGLSSVWSAPQPFTVLMGKPTAPPSLASASYPAGYWGAAGGGSFTIGAGGAGNIVGYAYALHPGTAAAGSPPASTDCSYNPGIPSPTSVNTTGFVPDSGGTAMVNLPASMPQGPYTLTVYSFDTAHNPSPTTSYTFYVAPSYGSAPTKFEGETAGAWSSATNPTGFAVQANCCGLTWSGGAQELLTGTASEASVGAGKGSTFSFTFTPSTTAEADYAISAAMTRSTDYGKLKFDIDGAVLANTGITSWNGYSPTAATALVDLGGIHLSAGAHTLNITVMDTDTASTGGRFNAGIDYLRAIPVNNVTTASFTAAMNNIGISDDASPTAGSLDDLSDSGAHSYSQQQLTAAGYGPGAAVDIDGATFTMPNVAAGRPDNVLAMGQTIPLPNYQQVKASAVGFLAAGTCAADPVMGSPGQSTSTIWANGFGADANPGHSLSGQVTYDTGAKGVYTMPPVPDWLTGPDAAAAVTLTAANGTTAVTGTPHLYALFAPTDPSHVLKSVTLPYIASAFSPGACRGIHIFAMAVRPADTVWTGAWASPTDNVWALGTPWSNQTVRTRVRPTSSGATVRIRLENTFSATPVTFGHVTLGTEATGAATTASPANVTFGGSASVTVPAGAEVFSDPVTFAVTAGTNLLVSYDVPGAVSVIAVHSMTNTSVWTTAAGAGDHSADTASAAFGTTLPYTAFLAGLDVTTPNQNAPGTIVVLGDGNSARSNGTGPLWPDLLAQATYTDPILGSTVSGTAGMGIVNASVYGNQTGSANPGSIRTGDQPVGQPIPASLTSGGGESAAGRYDRDVLGVGGAAAVIIQEGADDLYAGTGATRAADLATAVEQNLKNLAGSLHGYTTPDGSARVPVVVISTIPPFIPALPSTDIREQARALVNTDILTNPANYALCGASTSSCDVVDVDGAVRDAAAANQVKAADLTAGVPNDAFQNDVVNAVTTKEAGGSVVFAPLTPLYPIAALTLSHSAGIPPFAVTADASLSKAGSEGPIATYAFDFGDGTTTGPQTASTAAHTYTALGTYIVTVTVTDARGATSIGSQQVYSGIPAGFAVTVSGITTGQALSGSVNLSASASVPGVVTGVSYTITGPGGYTTTLAGGSAAANYPAQWSTTQLTNGAYTLTATAAEIDGANHMWPATPIAFTVANPVISGTMGDFNNDGKMDLVAVDQSGNLLLYPGTGGFGAFGAPTTIGTGWGGMAEITVGDLNGDGHPDIVAINTSNGNLMLYPGMGGTGVNYFGPASVIGTGWGPMTGLAMGDYNKDGKTDLLAVYPNGNLTLFPNTGGTGVNTFGPTTVIGTAWGPMTHIILADVNRDGWLDVMAVNPSGNLVVYPNTGGANPVLGNPVTAIAGWGTTAMSNLNLGDLNGDGRLDLLAIKNSTGQLMCYPGAADFQFGAPSQIGVAWGGMRTGA